MLQLLLLLLLESQLLLVVLAGVIGVLLDVAVVGVSSCRIFICSCFLLLVLLPDDKVGEGEDEDEEGEVDDADGLA